LNKQSGRAHKCHIFERFDTNTLLSPTKGSINDKTAAIRNNQYFRLTMPYIYQFLMGTAAGSWDQALKNWLQTIEGQQMMAAVITELTEKNTMRPVLRNACTRKLDD
jgi:hypothetical protein